MDDDVHDPYVDDLLTRVRVLEEENRELREELVRMTTVKREQVEDWRSVGW